MEMYGCKCDNCDKQWEDFHNNFIAFTDESSMENNIADDGEWHTDRENDKHYCPECWRYNDDDELEIGKALEAKK